ncbi:MAG: hypothetical protein ABI689_07015 [Thermoanaerobaculia bacterium]
MPASRPRRSRGLLLAAVVLLLPVAAVADELSFESIPWRGLTFEGSKFGISLTAELGLESVPADLVVGRLSPSDQTPGVLPTGPSVVAIRLASKVLGRKSEIELWVDPETATAFQRVQTDSGKRQRVKTERYGERGITGVRLRPAKGEEGLPSASWSDLRRVFSEYPAWAGKNLRISDPTALFYAVCAAKLERPGDRVQIPLFSDGDFLILEAKVVERRRVEVDYELVRRGSSRRRQGPVDALRLALRASTLGPTAEQHDFELAGLGGDVELLFDAGNRLPLELSGKVPWAGRVAIDLRRVVEP